MQKYSKEFSLLLIFFIFQITILLPSFFEVITMTVTISSSLIVAVILSISYIKEYRKNPPKLMAGRKNIYRAVFINLTGTLILATAFIITEGINEKILPFFLLGGAMVIFSAMESIGLVKTYKNQQAEAIDLPEAGMNIANIIKIICILWAFILIFGSLIYSACPYYFTFLNNVEFPLSWPEMAVADKEGNIYIDLGIYARIQKYDKEGNFICGFAYGKKGMSEVIIDRNDRLYIGSYHKNNILKVYDKNGRELLKTSAPGEDLTSWYLYEDGEVGLKPNERIVINETCLAVKKDKYIFTSTKFHKKIFQDKNGNKYIITKNIIYPLISRINKDGATDLTITPPIIVYLFTIPFPGIIIPLFIILFIELVEKKKK